MLSLLVTGFGPFADVHQNPSEAIAHALSGAVITNGTCAGRVTSAVLDVAWAAGRSMKGEPVDAAVDMLRATVARLRPDVLLSLGVMASEPRLLKIESRAVDLRAARPDVCGALPAEKHAHGESPRVLESSLPIAAILASLRDAGFAATASDDAGKFLCEAVAYEGARLAALAGSPIRRAGFVHVPNVRNVTPLVGAVRVVLESCLASL